LCTLRLQLITPPHVSSGSDSDIGLIAVAASSAPKADIQSQQQSRPSIEFWKSVIVIFRPAILDRDISIVDVSGFRQAPAKCRDEVARHRKGTRRMGGFAPQPIAITLAHPSAAMSSMTDHSALTDGTVQSVGMLPAAPSDETAAPFMITAR
jgi:hypothetical protein